MSITIINDQKHCVLQSATAVDSTAANSSDSFEMLPWVLCAIQVNWSAHGASTSTWELQGSNDGTNFDPIGGSSTTTSGASGTTIVNVSDLATAFVRVTVTSVSTQAGSLLTPIFSGKIGR